MPAASGSQFQSNRASPDTQSATTFEFQEFRNCPECNERCQMKVKFCPECGCRLGGISAKPALSHHAKAHSQPMYQPADPYQAQVHGSSFSQPEYPHQKGHLSADAGSAGASQEYQDDHRLSQDGQATVQPSVAAVAADIPEGFTPEMYQYYVDYYNYYGCYPTYDQSQQPQDSYDPNQQPQGSYDPNQQQYSYDHQNQQYQGDASTQFIGSDTGNYQQQYQSYDAGQQQSWNQASYQEAEPAPQPVQTDPLQRKPHPLVTFGFGGELTFSFLFFSFLFFSSSFFFFSLTNSNFATIVGKMVFSFPQTSTVSYGAQGHPGQLIIRPTKDHLKETFLFKYALSPSSLPPPLLFLITSLRPDN